MKPHALGGGPDCEDLAKLLNDGYSDSDVARLYGVRRQTATYWRVRCGIAAPGPGLDRPPRRERVSHKELIPWRVSTAHLNDPIRRRLVTVSLIRHGVDVSSDARARADELLAFLAERDVVVTYDGDHQSADGESAPFFFVPRDAAVDAPGDIIRRPTSG